MALIRGGSMHRAFRIVSVALVGMAMLMELSYPASADDRSEILRVRESVWRAWFANDTKTLRKLVPPDTIVITAGEDRWKTQAEVFQSAADFQKEGGKLIRLEFPRTEIQRFGEVVIVLEQISARNGNERATNADFWKGHGGVRATPRTKDQSGLAH